MGPVEEWKLPDWREELDIRIYLAGIELVACSMSGLNFGGARGRLVDTGHFIVLTGEGLGAAEESSLAPYARGSRSSRTGSIAADNTSERRAASDRMSE